MLEGIPRRILAASIILIALAVAPLVHGQALNGSVVGNVTDSKQAVVGGAAVALINVDTGQARQTVTSPLGSFDFPTVQPGNYQLRVTRDGFATYVQ